jgi:hypothetical protein
VSHQPQRKQKDCLNCGSIVQGKYCQICGQENIEIHQSFFSLTRHFIYDIFHFDGKFFDTLKYMLTRPGKIPREYINLDPIRMYLFTSAVFFIIFFSLRDPSTAFADSSNPILSRAERLNISYDLYRDPVQRENDINKTKLALLLDTSYTIYLFAPDSNDRDQLLLERDEKLYKMVGSRKNLLISDGDSLNWVSKQLSLKFRDYKERFGDDTQAMLSDFSNRFMHKLPYVLFVSLPLFALILKLLYRRKRNILYSDHVVFTLYQYILSFILLLLFFMVIALNQKLDWRILSFVSGILMFSIPTYLFFSLKVFYGDGIMRTLLKFLLLNLMAFVAIIVLMVLFVILSIIEI